MKIKVKFISSFVLADFMDASEVMNQDDMNQLPVHGVHAMLLFF
jgi:hypothetical protein